MGALQSFGSWIASFFSREVLTDAQKAAWEQSGYDAATRLIEAVKSKVGELVDWFRSLPGKIVAAIGNIDISGLIKWPSMPSWLGGGGGGGGSIRDRAANNNAGATIPLPGVAGARAAGGPVVGGRTYLVGEKGPELFTAGRSGTIIPNGGTSSLGGGSFTIGALHVHGVPGMSEESLAQKVVAEMERRFRAAMDGAQADLRAHRRDAGGVDHHVDQVVLEDEVGVVGDGDLAGFHRRGEIGGVGDLAPVALFLIGDIDGFQRVRHAQFGDRADLDARHMRDAGDDVGAHFAGADQPDADRATAVRPRLHVPRKADECHIRRHDFLLKNPPDARASFHYSILNICFQVNTSVHRPRKTAPRSRMLYRLWRNIGLL